MILANKLIENSETDDGSVLGNLFGETESIELRHQRVAYRVRHSPAASSLFPAAGERDPGACAAAVTNSSR